MFTYSAFEDGKKIASKATRQTIKLLTGISDSMLDKCINFQSPYKKIYYFKIDGEIIDLWKEEFTDKWNDMLKLFEKIKAVKHGKSV